MSLSLDLPQEVRTCQALTTLLLQSAAAFLPHCVFPPKVWWGGRCAKHIVSGLARYMCTD